MDKVFLVERIRTLEDYYRFSEAVKIFTTLEAAQAWVEAERDADRVKRTAQEEALRILAEWDKANPFVLVEQVPPKPRRWPSGMKRSDITPEMRAEREAAQALVDAFYARLSAAQESHGRHRRAHLEAVWSAEGHTQNLNDLSGFIPSEPPEFEIREMPVEGP